MNNIAHIVFTSIVQALQELRVNKLRSFLSLLGITIGIFCIIAVLTALDSARSQIQKNVNALGSDVLYIGRWPWPGMEEGEYKWWDYWRRPSMTKAEANAVTAQLHNMCIVSLALPIRSLTLKHDDQELSSIRGYGVTQNFDKVQNIEVAEGRYFSDEEVEGGSNTIILGSKIKAGLFLPGVNAIGKTVSVLGRRYTVVGVLKASGQDMAGFDFDNGIIMSYNSLLSVIDVHSDEYDVRLIVRANSHNNVMEVKDEVTGIIRRLHRLRPEQPNDFTVNQLSGITKLLNKMFDQINIIGYVIGGFSLLVGAFGIANIMFVTVKERTRIIGLKKAIGAKRMSILAEFLLEAVVLCLIGGLIGILIVLILSVIVSKLADIDVVLSVGNFIVGVTVSVIVGVVSGFIPARRAARLDPVVAIRSN